jgi:sugar lactone lactonase YvrE
MRRALVALGLALLGFVLWPSPIDPVAWSPPDPPRLAGPLAPNEALRAAERLAEGRIQGPEDLAFDAEGRVYASAADGRVQRLTAAGEVEDFADTGGRPLGLRFDAAGDLLVCDARRGLLAIDPAGTLRVLANTAERVPFRFTNNLDVASDGSVYFTDASSRFGETEYLYDLLEGRPHGRLLRYESATGRVEVLLRGLHFANGVALSRDEAFVLVSETYRYRIVRYWLKGPRAGTSEVFAEGLPGFPDNLDSHPRGGFWVALFTVRNPVADALAPRPWARSLLAKLPRFAWPKPAPYGLVLELDGQGRILRSLQDPGGRRVRQVTAAREHEGRLWLGSLEEPWIGRIALP